MNEKTAHEGSKIRFEELASGYRPKLPPKLAQLFPLKKQIQELRSRKASYDDIRLLLEDVNVKVSLDTVYRFCRDMLREKPDRPYKPRAPKRPASKVSPAPPPTEGIQTALQEQRARFPGPWSRRKRGPRIADSKNL
jgi:hypothetical protein